MKTARRMRLRDPDSYFAFDPHGLTLEHQADQISTLFTDPQSELCRAGSPWSAENQARFESNRQAKAPLASVSKQQVRSVNRRTIQQVEAVLRDRQFTESVLEDPESFYNRYTRRQKY